MNAIEFIGWKATGLRNRLVDRVWEWRLGVRTAGSVAVNHPDALRYAPFAYSAVWRVLRHMNLHRSDVFVDVGCGKGRVICCAAQMAECTVIGVDIEPALCQAARVNAARLHSPRASVEIINTLAQEFDYRQCTAVFMFNPFGAATMREVMQAVGRSLAERPRALRLAYVNPTQDDVLQEAGLFERYDRWNRAPFSGLKFDVSFWRTPGSE